MIPQRPSRTQARSSVPGPDRESPWSDTDETPVPGVTAGGPTYCPTCGRAYFGPQASGLLDLVVLIHESAGKVKAVLETVVIP